MDKIAIISDINIDKIWVDSKLTTIRLGGCAVNAARSFQKRFVQPIIIGSVGKDEEAITVKNLLEKEHFRYLLNSSEYPTGVCNITYDNGVRNTKSQKCNANQYDCNVAKALTQIDDDAYIFITTHFLLRACNEDRTKMLKTLKNLKNKIIVDIVPHRIYEKINFQKFIDQFSFPIFLLIAEAETILYMNNKYQKEYNNLDEICNIAIKYIETKLDVQYVALRCGTGNISWQYLYRRNDVGRFILYKKINTGYETLDLEEGIGFGDELTANTLNLICHRKPPTVWGNHWEKDIHKAARKEGKLLRIAVAIPGGMAEQPCNFKCRFCFTEYGTRFKGKNCVTNNTVRHFVKDASYYTYNDKYTNYFLVSEGEPTLNPELCPILEEISGLGGTITIFTNLYELSDELISTFKKIKNLFVCGKMYGINDITNDYLTQVSGSFKKMMHNIELLREAGLAAEGRLGVQCVITSYNYDQVFEIFKWCREKEIVPHIMMYRKQGFGELYPEYEVPTERIQELFERCSMYDREKYGYEWQAKLPMLVHGECEIPGINIYLTNDGSLRLCACDQQTLGHYPEESIKDVLESKRFKKAAENGGCLWFKSN